MSAAPLPRPVLRPLSAQPQLNLSQHHLLLWIRADEECNVDYAAPFPDANAPYSRWFLLAELAADRRTVDVLTAQSAEELAARLSQLSGQRLQLSSRLLEQVVAPDANTSLRQALLEFDEPLTLPSVLVNPTPKSDQPTLVLWPWQLATAAPNLSYVGSSHSLAGAKRDKNKDRRNAANAPVAPEVEQLHPTVSTQLSIRSLRLADGGAAVPSPLLADVVQALTLARSNTKDLTLFKPVQMRLSDLPVLTLRNEAFNASDDAEFVAADGRCVTNCEVVSQIVRDEYAGWLKARGSEPVAHWYDPRSTKT